MKFEDRLSLNYDKNIKIKIEFKILINFFNEISN